MQGLIACNALLRSYDDFLTRLNMRGHGAARALARAYSRIDGAIQNGLKEEKGSTGDEKPKLSDLKPRD